MTVEESKLVTVHETTRLRVGMRIMYGDAVYRVVLVNQCRALCDPEEKTREVRIPKRFGEEGEEKVFHARSSSISISPNSEVHIL